MKIVTVNKADLLEKLKENKEKHVKEYKESFKGWLETSIKELEKGIEILKTNPESASLFFNISKPLSYEKNYTLAIGMLEMHNKNQVDISSSEYQKYINDEWEWTESFKHMSSTYKQ